MSQQIKVVLNYFIEPNDVGHVNYRLRKSLTIDLVRKAVQSLLICYTISESHVYITLLHTQTRTRGFLIILVSKRLSFWKNLSLKIFLSKSSRAYVQNDAKIILASFKVCGAPPITIHHLSYLEETVKFRYS